jgi:hypothetical protein
MLPLRQPSLLLLLGWPPVRLVLGIHQTAELQIAKHKKTFAMGSVTMMPPVGSETLKKLVAIAATLLVVSAGTEVPLEGSC